MNPAIEYRVFWNDNVECRAYLPGPWTGELADVLKGSFVGYVCDQGMDHDGYHIDSVAGVAWSDAVGVPQALAGSIPTV